MDPGELPWLPMGSGMMSMDGNSARNTSQMLRDMVTVMQRHEGDGLTQQQIQQIIEELPRLTEEDLEASGQYDGSCPICMNTYLAALAEEEMSLVMDSPAHPAENLGVTRLSKTCGHIFCRKDLLTWIRDGHPSCPLCRTSFVTASRRDAQPRAPREDTGNAHDEAEEDEGDDEYNQAMQRIVAAYREERSRLQASPDGGVFWPDAMGRQTSSESEHTDERNEYAGMYS